MGVTKGRPHCDEALYPSSSLSFRPCCQAAGSSWPRALLTPLGLVDVLSFAPGLLELCGAAWLGGALAGAGVDLRWFRIFRCARPRACFEGRLGV